MPISVILAAVDAGADSISLAATAPDAFLLGAQSAVEHWGGTLEWRKDGTLCARLRGDDPTALIDHAARCAVSLRSLVPGPMALSIDDDEATALIRAHELLLRGGDGVHVDERARQQLEGSGFELDRDVLVGARSLSARVLAEGDVVGRYTVEGVLGQGGMGMVYRARDARLGRAVALKLLAPGRGGSDAAARLLREARAAASFAHPNVVAVHDVGESDGVPWVAMELIEGRSLRDAIGDRSVPLPERLRWLLDVAHALAAGHRAGLVHRDVKPDNVMVRRDGVVKVLDYGIARRLAEEGALGELATLTGEGMILGTPLYMAPEQMRGDAIDARADQFAWGVTAYELLSGQRPWGIAGDMKALARMLTTSAEPIGKLVPELPEELAATIDRAIARNAEDRFDGLDEIIDVFERHVEVRSLSIRPSSRMSRPAPKKSRRAPMAALLAAAVIGLGVLGVRRVGLKRPATPPVEALQTWADGSSLPAQRALEAAVARDPSAAALWLRLAIWTEDLASARAAFQHAQRLRAKLDDHDRALLDAFEPRHRAPPDAAEWDARLSRLAEQRPTDGEVRVWLARAKRMRGEHAVAAELLERTVKENPSMAAAALAQLGDLLRHQHRYKDALAVYDRCVASSAGAIDCYAGRARVRGMSGDCAGLEADARQWATLDPADPAAEDSIATVLFARHAPIPAVREALRAKAEKVPASRRAVVEQEDAYRLAVAEGDFVAARANAEARAAALPSGAGFFPHFQVSVDVMLAMNESNDVLASGGFSYDFVKRARAWTAESVAQASYPMLMLGRAYTGGALPRSEFVRERAEMLSAAEAAWARAGKPRDGYQRSVMWISAHGLAEYAEEDVTDALRALPGFEPLPSPGAISPEIDAMIGAFYRAAKRPDDALPYLRVITSSCNALVMPFGYAWAHVELGRALEQKGEVNEAIAAYRVVVNMWGGARPRSRALDAARARLAILEPGAKAQ